MTISALLFDLDGTLIHTDDLHAAVFAEIGRDHGVTIDRARYDAEVQGRLNADIFADLFPGADAAALAEVKEARVRARLAAEAVPIRGLAPVLDWAAGRGIPTAVVTNAPRANAETMLAALGLQTAFATLVVGEECLRGKPDPLPYATALDRLDVAAETALAFEDSPSGIRSACAAGLDVVGICSTIDADVLRTAGARDAIADFTDPWLRHRLETKSRTPSR